MWKVGVSNHLCCCSYLVRKGVRHTQREWNYEHSFYSGCETILCNFHYLAPAQSEIREYLSFDWLDWKEVLHVDELGSIDSNNTLCIVLRLILPIFQNS